MDNFSASKEFSNTLLIYTDESLDLSSLWKFKEAEQVINNNPQISTVVVNLGKTRKMFDSGKSVLLAFQQATGNVINRIYLTNVDEKIEQQLIRSKLCGLLEIRCKQSV